VGAASHPRAPTCTRFALAQLGQLWRDAGLIGPAAEVRERFGTTPFWLLRHVAMRLAIQRRRLAAEAVAGLDCSYLLRLGMQDVLIGYNDKLDIATGRVMGRIGIINCYQFVSSLPRVRRGALSVKPLHKVFEEYVRLKEQSQAEVGRAIFGEGDGSARLRGGLDKWAGRRNLGTAAVREAAAAVKTFLARVDVEELRAEAGTRREQEAAAADAGAGADDELHKLFEEYVRLKEQSQAEVGRAIFGEGEDSARLRRGLKKWAARRNLGTAAVKEAAAVVKTFLAAVDFEELRAEAGV